MNKQPHISVVQQAVDELVFDVEIRKAVSDLATPETLSIADDTVSLVSTKNTETPRNDEQHLVDEISKCTIGLEKSVRITNWCGTKYFSDLVHDGLEYLEPGSGGQDVVMVYECPSSSVQGTSFHNSNVYKIHDYPPTPFEYICCLRPLRYSVMNGSAFPSYLKDKEPELLLKHWEKSIPNFQRPSFVQSIPLNAKVNAYLPMESVPGHINDPDMHYHLAGKDAINLMTDKTTRLLPNTRDNRPCIAKVTHAMGSLGIFIIHNDKDEAKFFDFCAKTGNPDYVVTELVDIDKNLSCHFFMHPNGEIVWFGSSENLRLPDGSWSSDSTIEIAKQQEYQELMAPYVCDVATYCLSNGFWGFMGIDVLFDPQGVGYVVDVNPRVTGTMPALMLAKHVHDVYGLSVGKFRKSSKHVFPGSTTELLRQVEDFNERHVGKAHVTVFSVCEINPSMTMLNVAVLGTNHNQCEEILDRFAKLV